MVMNGVIGTDGQYPIVDNEPLFRIWSIHQLWKGQAGEDRYVPKVKDWAVDPDTGEFWVVDHIDPVSLIPTLRSFVPGKITGSFTEIDAFVGSGPGTASETYRVYRNDAVYPHTLAVDAALHIRGSMASYAKLFLGSDITAETGKVLSKLYDASGHFVGTSIPLELAELDSHTNYSTKIVPRCHSTEENLKNDELVTLVVYADDGHVVYKRQLLIENTDTIAAIHASTKYITEISLESVWLSNTIPDLLQYPLNIPMNSLNMVGVVLYSDGSTVRYPVGSGKFEMIGMQGRLSSVEDQPADLVLRYTLGQNELAYSSTGENNRFITKPYKIVTINPNHSVSVKLFAYPEWVSDALGYRIRWFLLNMERNVFFEVTDQVKFSTNTGAFNPKQFGYLQRKSVSVNLADVSPSFIPFIHTQVVDIVLNQKPSNDLIAPWLVSHIASENPVTYGVDLYGSVVGNQVNFKSGFATRETWLENFYLKTQPLVQRNTELAAPEPTHFVVHFGITQTEYPLSQWDKPVTIGSNVVPGRNAYLRFIKRTPTGDQQLSCAGVTLKQL